MEETIYASHNILSKGMSVPFWWQTAPGWDTASSNNEICIYQQPPNTDHQSCHGGLILIALYKMHSSNS